MNTRPGRNEPCPCGSGRKFKHCCLSVGAREFDPGYDPAASYERGVRALASGNAVEAIVQLRMALSQAPAAAEIHAALGDAQRSSGQTAAALASYRRALALRPDLHGLHLNIGVCLEALGKFDEAMADYRQAITAGPPDARLHHNLGMSLRRQGRLDEALEHFLRACELAPRAEASVLALAGTLQALGRCEEGAAELERALALQPGSADLHAALGNWQLELGRVEEATESLERACALDPSATESHSARAMALLYRESGDDEKVAAAHRAFVARFASHRRTAAALPRNDPDPERRLRIGYVSGDLRSHSVAYFIEPVLANHDRGRFAVHCYRTSGPVDRVTERLRGLAEVWVESAHLSEDMLAQRIREDRIDILVDLSGHTAGNRLLTFASRPAPIQLCWIGYPAHPGLASIDALLSDAVASPSDTDGAPPAGVWCLPRVFSCYRPPENAPDTGRCTHSASSGVVFGSFNKAAKISEPVIGAWSRILLEIPGARLLLKDRSFSEAGACRRMQARFATHGVGADRLNLLSRVPDDESHLAMYREVDVALDTFPYNGVTTTCEALWMGVPVVTLAGRAFRSRMGATLLASVGYPQWVAHDWDGYVRRAVVLARNEPGRERLRAGLRETMRGSPLMDAPGYTREFEALLRERWRAWCRAQTAPATLAQS
jgi:predicted O-linked N-acetylglucosamine transferase (SPINDLY family)